jgi:RNA polymerase sigma-70 factor (ECF subfamily)
MSSLSDEELMAGFRDSEDESAIEELIERHSSAGLAVARIILRCEQSAEDALQEAFVRVVRHRDRFGKDRAFAPWFYTLLRNVCRDMLRRRKAHQVMVDVLALFGRAEEQTTLEPGVPLGMLDLLPAIERDVLYYRIVCEMTLEEAAAACGCSLEAAKKRSQRGLAFLRARLAGEESAGALSA